jgi:glycosyltransferase involved in cell wall biosynthesis
MKILNAIHAQNIGGVEQVFFDYSEVLIKNGHEVALVLSSNNCGGQIGRYDLLKPSRIFRLKNLTPIFDLLHLWLILLTFKPDIMICHSRRLMKWAKILKFLTPVKIVAVNHGISFESSLDCDYIISINKQIHEMIVAKGHDKNHSFVLPNSIKIDQQYCQKTLRNPPVIGMYGRIEPRKGFDILFRAAQVLQEQGFDFRLKIGGFSVSESYNIQTLRDLVKEYKIADKTSFVGVVTDKVEFFKDVDIFCIPSREEPFGLVILEGFLHSTLVISSTSDGGKFLIKDQESGFLFSIENHQDLAEKIKTAVSDQDKYLQITRNAFSDLESRFSSEFLSKEIELILNHIKHD